LNLTFQKIKIDNFMCFDKEQFDFESNMGISLITGTNNDIPGSKNGCGKSSLINAFIFALFGKMLNQTSLRSISNRHLPVRDTEIVLHFKADDVPFVIVSGIGISPFKSYCKLYKHSISKQNDLTKHSTRETRLYIEKNILKTDFEVFLRSFVLTSDQAYSFFSMKKQDKRTFIENIFDLKIFGEMYRNIHRDNLENEKELTAVERVAYTQRNDISEMKEKKEDAGNTSQEDVLTEEVKKLRESIEDKKRLISKIDIEKVEKGIQSLNDYITGVNSRKESIKIQITNKNQLINNILKKEYSDKISYVKKYIDTYNELSEHSKPIVSKKLGLDEVKEQAKDLVKKIKEESELLKKLKEKESKLVVGDDIHEKLKKLKEAKKKVEEEKALIKELAFQQIKFGNELRKVKDGVDLIDDLLIKKREDLDKTQKELDICVKNKNILTFIENIVGEDNVRRLVVADLIKMLNKQIQTYLSSMGADYTCMFDKDLNYTFITSNGETEYGSFSSGEKMRLSIAISFAFRDFIVNRSGINSNILILDEYIDGNLDDLAVTEIFKILREFNVLYNQNIYVISHREAVKVNTFDNVISVDKTNGVSVITKEKGV
jgi:DNA repair exonuclease SbcCD ATPase subunit